MQIIVNMSTCKCRCGCTGIIIDNKKQKCPFCDKQHKGFDFSFELWDVWKLFYAYWYQNNHQKHYNPAEPTLINYVSFYPQFGRWISVESLLKTLKGNCHFSSILWFQIEISLLQSVLSDQFNTPTFVYIENLIFSFFRLSLF